MGLLLSAISALAHAFGGGEGAEEECRHYHKPALRQSSQGQSECSVQRLTLLGCSTSRMLIYSSFLPFFGRLKPLCARPCAKAVLCIAEQPMITHRRPSSVAMVMPRRRPVPFSRIRRRPTLQYSDARWNVDNFFQEPQNPRSCAFIQFKV